MTVRQSLGLLRDRRFAWYFSGRLVSTAGSTMAPVALTFAVLHTSESPTALSQVLAAHMVPMIVFMLVGGVVADKLPRILVLQVAHVLSALTQGTSAYLVITGRAQIWMLVVLAALNGTVSAFTLPAMAGVVPQLFPKAVLQQANSLLAFSRSALSVLGPSLAGVLVVGVGPGWALGVDALSWLVAAACMTQVRVPMRAPRDTEARTTMLTDLREGWSEFRSRQWVWVVVLVFGVGNAIHSGAWDVIGPVLATSTATIGARGWGLVLSLQAAGVVIGTVIMMRARVARPLRAGVSATIVFGLPLVMLGLTSALWIVGAAALVAGLAVEVFEIAWLTSLQEHVPEHLLSRVSSYDALGSFVAIPVGQLGFGLLASRFDSRVLLLWAGLAYTLIMPTMLLSPSVRNLRAVMPDPSAERVQPGTP